NHELYHTVDQTTFRYALSGIIYSRQSHFVARIVDSEGSIWYHDGMTTGRCCIKENTL
ncbi:hypothetical protein CPB84DRAFT_1644916, partial [Gymnopilus junonius]